MQNKNLSGIAALITSVAVAGGLIWTIVQYSIDTGRQERLQDASYTEIKKQLESFSGNVASDVKEMKTQIQTLQVEMAVLKATTRRNSVDESRVVMPESMSSIRVKSVELKDLAQVKAESMQQVAQ